MKHALILSVGVFTFGASGIISAQISSPPPVHAIAAITFGEAVMQTNEAQREFSQLQAKFAPRETHLKTLNNELDSMRKELNALGDKLSEDEKATRLKTIENKDKQLQREADDYRNDFQTESQESFRKVAQKVYAFLQDYSQQHGYTFVLERGSAENPIVWYVARTSDITDAVAQAYNVKSGIPAPAKGSVIPPNNQ
jgi:Skp family chaperone for outer membrane proteins